MKLAPLTPQQATGNALAEHFQPLGAVIMVSAYLGHFELEKAEAKRVLERGLIFSLLAYFLFHFAMRVLVRSSTLELDEAEQVVFSQWLMPGYSAQPPLYTWIQIPFFWLFGSNVTALSLLKNILLFTTYLLVYTSSKRLLGDTRWALLPTLSLLLVPDISWGSQLDHTHTVLVVTVSAATFYVVLCLLESRSTLRYGLLGILLGLGILSKYTFLVFAASLLPAVLTTAAGREALLDKRILLTGALALLIASPHLSWLSSHLSVTDYSGEKLKMGDLSFFHLLQGFGNLARATTAFLTPLWIICLILFPAGFKKARNNPPRGAEILIERYFLTLAALLAAIVLISHATDFKARWLQPLLFLFPLYFFTRLKRVHPLGDTALRRFLSTTATAALVVLLAFFLRVLGPSWNYFSRSDYPFDAVAEQIRASGFDHGVIIGNRSFTAGNLLLRFPKSTAFSPELSAMDLPGDTMRGPLLIAWDTERSFTLPERLKNYVQGRFHLGDVELNQATRYLMVPYRYAPSRYIAMGIILLPGTSR